MSNLLVQNIKHTNNTTAQTIDTSGRTTAVLNNDTTYRSDNGAVTQNLVQGVAKFFIAIATNGTSGSADDSFNISSIDDDANADCGFNFTNNYNNANFATAMSCVSSNNYGAGNISSCRIQCVNAKTTSSVECRSAFIDGDGDWTDHEEAQSHYNCSGFGDLA